MPPILNLLALDRDLQKYAYRINYTIRASTICHIQKARIGSFARLNMLPIWDMAQYDNWEDAEYAQKPPEQFGDKLVVGIHFVGNKPMEISPGNRNFENQHLKRMAAQEKARLRRRLLREA